MAVEHRKPGWKDAVPHDVRLPLLLGGGLLTALLLLAFGLMNLLVVILACGLFVLLERTVGDWLVDIVGPAGRSILVAIVLFAVSWQFLSSPARRATTLSFLGLDAYWVMDKVPGTGLEISPSSAPPPANTGSASATAGTVGAGVSSPQSRTANGPTASTETGSSTGRVRMSVAARSDATGVRLEARLNGADKIEGIVDFIVDGKRVATASVSPDGSAVAHVPGLGPGSYRVEARFRGRSDSGQASSAITVVK